MDLERYEKEKLIYPHFKYPTRVVEEGEEIEEKKVFNYRLI
jgi:hypothetical protein